LDIASAKPSDRIGIICLDGLGHLALQYTCAWGCDPVVFSRTAGEDGDALELGAKEFYLIPSEEQAQIPIEEGVNVLLLCGGQLPNFEMYV
jgi:alcohol dehydrogenase (NADP+)